MQYNCSKVHKSCAAHQWLAFEKEHSQLVEELAIEGHYECIHRNRNSIGSLSQTPCILLYQRQLSGSSSAIELLNGPYSSQSHSATPWPSQSHSDDSDNQA